MKKKIMKNEFTCGKLPTNYFTFRFQISLVVCEQMGPQNTNMEVEKSSMKS